MVTLSPICHSLNASVQDHRRLLDLLLAIREDLLCDVSISLPVFDALDGLAALYEAAASSPPASGWALWTPSADRGRAPALDAFLRGELTTDPGDTRQHVPIFACDGNVRLVVSVAHADDGSGHYIFSAPEAIYRAVGRSGLLELAAE